MTVNLDISLQRCLVSIEHGDEVGHALEAGMFQRLESVLHSEIKNLGRPRVALLGFAVAVLAYTVLGRCCSAW